MNDVKISAAAQFPKDKSLQHKRYTITTDIDD